MTKQQILDSITIKDYSVSSETVELSYGGIARALFPDVIWFFDKQEGSYSGDWYMVGRDKDGRYYFFSMGYGSCSGCDWLEDVLSGLGRNEDGALEELAKMIDRISDTPILANKEAALEYARKFDWSQSYERGAPNSLVREVIEAIEAQV